MDDNADVRVRFVLNGASSASGNNRYDNLKVEATELAPEPVTVTQELSFTTPGVENTAAGWRHLSPPVAGFDMADLAALNLVQGVPAGAANTTAQYEAFTDNVYVGYGTTGFLVADDMDHEFGLGEGFLWYLYDNTRGPFAGGTSVSTELTDFELTATGVSPTADWLTPFTDYLGEAGSRFYMIGNPFARPLAASGVSITPGAIQAGLIQVYNPDPATGGPGYMDLYTTNPSDYLAVWQGAFIEVASAGDQTVTYDWEATDENADPAFYGKTVADAISFRLVGALASGATTADGAAHVRFNDAATPGWDIHDASKLTPPLTHYALVAPVLVRDGEAYRVAVSAVPAQAATIPVAFKTTGAGTFTLSWTAALPSGLSGTLRDLATGAVVDLSAGSYAFTAEAGAWSDRFEIVVTGNVVAGEETPEAALTVGAVRPNPTVGASSVRVTAPAGEAVSVRVYDALGRNVAVAFQGAVAAGGQDVALPTAGLAPGAYVVRVEGATASAVRRLTVLR